MGFWHQPATDPREARGTKTQQHRDGRGTGPWSTQHVDAYLGDGMTTNQLERLPPVIACVDVGSPKAGSVGWAIRDKDTVQTGQDLYGLMDALMPAIQRHRKMALGFECPLYIPLRESPKEMTKCRRGERLAWSTGAGATVLSIGLAQVHWVLTELIKHGMPKNRGTTQWASWSEGDSTLLLWEAYITQNDGIEIPVDGIRGNTAHERDAAAGTWAMWHKLQREPVLSSDFGDEKVLSLIGMQLLATDQSKNTELLYAPCVVLKAKKPI